MKTTACACASSCRSACRSSERAASFVFADVASKARTSSALKNFLGFHLLVVPVLPVARRLPQPLGALLRLAHAQPQLLHVLHEMPLLVLHQPLHGPPLARVGAALLALLALPPVAPRDWLIARRGCHGRLRCSALPPAPVTAPGRRGYLGLVCGPLVEAERHGLSRREIAHLHAGDGALASREGHRPPHRPVELPSPAVAQGRSSINHWPKSHACCSRPAIDSSDRRADLDLE